MRKFSLYHIIIIIYVPLIITYANITIWDMFIMFCKDLSVNSKKIHNSSDCKI